MALEFPQLSEAEQITRAIEFALQEDVGTGDISANSTIPADAVSDAYFVAKARGIVAGLSVAEEVFRRVDTSVRVAWQKKDGDAVVPGDIIGTASGSSRAILVAERTALNFMQRMSGIATLTNAFVRAVAAAGSRTRILDTRKTAPGLRAVDKLAVRLGGGVNHRIGLYDMVMIKDNHIDAAGGITPAVANVAAAFAAAPSRRVPIEVETGSLADVEEALRSQHLGVTRLMFDNMTTAIKCIETGNITELDTSLVAQAQALVDADQAAKLACGDITEAGRIETEVSGNVTLLTVGAIAKTNVDFISSGQLTHSVTALDISLKFGPIPAPKSAQ